MADEASIILKVDGTAVTAHPIFGDDIKVKVEKQDGEVFYRTKVEGTIKFVREDFDLIASVSHNSVLTLEVLFGSQNIGTCDFLKSDTTLDYDDRICTIKIAMKDGYEKFLADYNNKYNLVNLKPTIESILLTKRPILQFYALGDKKLTNTFGNMSFEVNTVNEAESKNSTQLANLGFTELFHRIMFTVNDNAYMPSGAIGDYVGTYSGSVQSVVVTNSNGYSWKYEGTTQGGQHRFALFDSNNNIVTSQYISMFYFFTWSTFVTDFFTRVDISALYSGGSNVVTTGEFRNRTVFGRLLIDYDIQISGWVDSPIAINTLSDDIYDNSNSNYSYICGINSFQGKQNVVFNANKVSTPTKYYYKDGLYYAEQTSYYPRGVAFPIGPSMWAEESYWYISDPSIADWLDANFGWPYTLKDAFPLHSVIQSLLTAMGTDLEFSNSNVYSKFLYESGDAGLMDTIPSPSMRGNYIYISPITNVKKTRYEQPAQRGDITLKEVLEMLKKVYQCYWYLDGVGRLCIEHISYFKNNMNYGLFTPTPLIDLTSMKDMPNGKMWAFDKNAFEFDRANCPSRYEFAWGNDCTEQFNGYAIDIKDKWAMSDKKENMTVTNFISDIDYSVIYPQGVSDDIYAVMEADKTTHEVAIAHLSLGDNGEIYNIQNPYLSFLFAEQNYYNCDLGGWDAEAEGVTIPVYAVRHICVQSVGVPLAGRILSYGLDLELAAIKTGLGIGLLKEASVNANTSFADTKVTMQAERDDYKDCIALSIGAYSHGYYAIFMQNTSNTVLDVRYSYQGGSVVTETISGGSGVVVGIGSQSDLDLADVAILSAAQNNSYNLCIGDVIKRYGSQIEVSLNQTSPDTIVASFDGQGYTGGKDFAYIKVKINKDATVTIQASTESNSDYGYVGHQPCAKKTQILTPGICIESASGTQTATASVTAGMEVYIGYMKDSSAVGGNDTVTITITEN